MAGCFDAKPETQKEKSARFQTGPGCRKAVHNAGRAPLDTCATLAIVASDNLDTVAELPDPTSRSCVDRADSVLAQGWYGACPPRRLEFSRDQDKWKCEVKKEVHSSRLPERPSL
jgi:hypothetical protein